MDAQSSRMGGGVRHLFDDEHQRYTNEGSRLDSELVNVMRPIMEKFRDAGVSARDMGLVAILAANEIMLDFVLDIPGRYSEPPNPTPSTS